MMLALRTLVSLFIVLLIPSIAFGNDVRFTFTEPTAINGTYGCYIRLDDTATGVNENLLRSTGCIACKTCVGDEKATAVMNALNAIAGGRYVAAVAPGTCQVTVTSAGTWKITQAGWLRCNKCKQRDKRIDDPTPENRGYIGTFDVTGAGTEVGASLGVSMISPASLSDTITVEVQTEGKSDIEILDEMADSLTANGYAVSRDGQLVIVGPVRPYIVFGTSDSTQTDSLNVLIVPSVPALSDSGMMVVVLLLLAAGAVFIGVRRTRRAAA